MEEKVQKIAESSNTNNVDTFMKIYDSQERIKLTVLCDFFITKNYKLLLRFETTYDLGEGGSKKTSTLFAQLGYIFGGYQFGSGV